VGAATSRY